MKIYVLIFLILASCSHMQDFFFPEDIAKDAKLEWRKNIKMKINGNYYRGIAVLPRSNIYTIKIYPSGKEIDRLQWGTCHGEDYADQAVEHGFWPWNKKDEYFTLEFRPQPIELEKACPLEIEELAEKHRSMGFGMVIWPDFRSHYRLEATLECNRETKIFRGTSACQSHVGAITRIRFAKKVYQDERPSSECPPFKEVRPGIFEFNMPKALCAYVFVSTEKDAFGNRLTHRLYTYGFQANPPPKGT